MNHSCRQVSFLPWQHGGTEGMRKDQQDQELLVFIVKFILAFGPALAGNLSRNTKSSWLERWRGIEREHDHLHRYLSCRQAPDPMAPHPSGQAPMLLPPKLAGLKQGTFQALPGDYRPNALPGTTLCLLARSWGTGISLCKTETLKSLVFIPAAAGSSLGSDHHTSWWMVSRDYLQPWHTITCSAPPAEPALSWEDASCSDLRDG